MTLQSGQPHRVPKGKRETQYPPGGTSSSPTISTVATPPLFVPFQSCISFTVQFPPSGDTKRAPLYFPAALPVCGLSCAPRQLPHSSVRSVTGSWHPGRANQVRHLAPGRAGVPAVPLHLCMSIRARERVQLRAGTPPPALQCPGERGKGPPDRNWFVS